MNHTMNQARRDFKIGYLTKYQIERTVDGWIIILGEGNSLGFLADTRKKYPRVFKSLDRAVNTLEVIGFTVKLLH